VSRSDLMKGLFAALPKADAGHPDAEIKAVIQAELDKLGWTPRASVRVEVINGAVTFGGAITDERLRSGLRVIAENTPGAAEVRDHLCWIEPNSGFYVPPEEEKEASKP
jgi:osmotically-inducible protein OsmY